ncbi:MAG: hypothetical protein A3G93_08985 [Nitrospinae bacterium RIFCSPLOWO2_12_FULL_45_22]|nr:MAG: hypothetical protein A3G93_08985 [Nitrospinae bacterium RIFCSPLOWO2_12_FULL_45_22]
MFGIGIVLLSHFPFVVKRNKSAQKFNTESFRAGVGAVIYKADWLVLAFERSDRSGSWQLPQGGVEHRETLEQALFREIREETGLTRDHLTICLEVPTWMGYELPLDARSEKTGRGQIHKWFFLEFVGNEAAINLKAGGEFRAWRWSDLRELADSAVEFRRPVYSQLVAVAAAKVWQST